MAMNTRRLIVITFISSLLLAACSGASSDRDGTLSGGIQATDTREAVLIPTIYRLYVVYKDRQTCSSRAKRFFYSTEGKRLQSVCLEDYNRCRLEGSCDVIESGRVTPIGFVRQSGSQDQWRIYDRRRCPYGSGAQETCLDPFRSVAADLNFWKIGDVIHIPMVEGIELPDGTIHDGFFVVRDTGGAINGPHRFDFYVGRTSQKTVVNIFSKLKLNDRQTQVTFRRATPSETSVVLAQRRFPEVPRSQR